MELPLDILVNNIEDSFKTLKLYLFKNRDYDKNAPKHYHISIKVKNNNYVLLTLITSQVDKKKRFYKLSNPKLLESLIIISSDDIDVLSKESCIDCNQPIFLTKEELLAKIDGSIEFIEVKMDMNLKEKIIQAIKKSPMVRDEIKEQIN